MPVTDAANAPKNPRCPICAKPASHDFRPFCSKRCADVDLGRWLGGRYAIPGEPAPQGETPEDGESGSGQSG